MSSRVHTDTETLSKHCLFGWSALCLQMAWHPSFEYDFLLFIYDNIFAYVEYWKMISYVINDNPITTTHFSTMLLVKILSISAADEEVTSIGLAISGQKL